MNKPEVLAPSYERRRTYLSKLAAAGLIGLTLSSVPGLLASKAGAAAYNRSPNSEQYKVETDISSNYKTLTKLLKAKINAKQAGFFEETVTQENKPAIRLTASHRDYDSVADKYGYVQYVEYIRPGEAEPFGSMIVFGADQRKYIYGESYDSMTIVVKDETNPNYYLMEDLYQSPSGWVNRYYQVDGKSYQVKTVPGRFEDVSAEAMQAKYDNFNNTAKFLITRAKDVPIKYVNHKTLKA